MNLIGKAKKGEELFYQKFRKQFSLRIMNGRGEGGAVTYNLKKITDVINKLNKEYPEETNAYFQEIFKQGYDGLYLYYLGMKIRKNGNLSLCYEYAKHDWYKQEKRLEDISYCSNEEFEYSAPISAHTSYELTT